MEYFVKLVQAETNSYEEMSSLDSIISIFDSLKDYRIVRRYSG